ncbi:hypothetical protein AMECASPLE_007218 [Ameca splendens]|uniref:Uncharacterized protein n=1 Tax=Ameca splendens TaxID=208324 RepID=A0ABV0XCQ0_9TELE
MHPMFQHNDLTLLIAPVPPEEKHQHNMMLPHLSNTVGMGFSGSQKSLCCLKIHPQDSFHLTPLLLLPLSLLRRFSSQLPSCLHSFTLHFFLFAKIMEKLG